VPRHRFTASSSLEVAYDDRVIRLKEDHGVLISSLSQPAMIVEMLQQLDVQEGSRVLEIGTGSGYTTALLAELTGRDGRVVSIDLEPDLVAQAQTCFAALGYEQIYAFAGDGTAGDAPHAPFDRILLTVCVTDIEQAWWDQIAPGGRIVLPLSFNGVQKSIAFAEYDGMLTSSSTIDCGFVMVRGASQRTTTYRLSEDPEIYLSAEGETSIDRAAILARLTHDAPLILEVPGEYSTRDFYAGAMLWLALHDERFCRLELGTKTGRPIPALLAPSSGNQVTIGLCSADSIALLGFQYRVAPRLPLLYVSQYGGNNALSDRLFDLLRQWDEAGRPGGNGIKVTAYQNEHHHPVPRHFTAALRRPSSTFYLTMP
ncbi:MAG: methyltransferase domain-containing protein, partial [Candidatus Eremiobacteraeota bacterium]|nr:methyltransferase domain-containing protein [Candidatus Eremiobacteraeota bacterium]